ncbi:MAG TPA: 3-deoxy-7-phosphoheptulonate synthase [Thermomicrobiales bacterium]|nr:3-deoxy-7-phosphoheptulonate synthase [Thermomicrobiales bacterium]
MIIVMKTEAPREQLNAVVERVKELGLSPHLIDGEERTIVGVVGLPLPPTLDEMFEVFPGVEQVVRISKKYKLAGWDFHPHKTVIEIGDVRIGGDEVTVIAGPCSVENEVQTLSTAMAVKEAGATILRGGAFKPRTSPYEFRGLGEEGLKILAKAREETGLKIITEVMTPSDVDLVGEYTDIFQIGARNCQNYLLLEEVGKAKKPVMLKRGLSMLIEEWLLAAEYVMAQDNPDVILCERGIRTYETATRNTLDVSAVPVLQSMSHLPVFIDPSHAAGKRQYVESLSLAGIAAGADGLIIEVHPSPDNAMSDGAQSLTFDQFASMMPKVSAVAQAVGRGLHIQQPVAAD